MRLPPVICLNKFQKAIKLIGDGFIYLIIIVEVCRHKFFFLFWDDMSRRLLPHRNWRCFDYFPTRVRDNFKDL